MSESWVGEGIVLGHELVMDVGEGIECTFMNEL